MLVRLESTLHPLECFVYLEFQDFPVCNVCRYIFQVTLAPKPARFRILDSKENFTRYSSGCRKIFIAHHWIGVVVVEWYTLETCWRGVCWRRRFFSWTESLHQHAVTNKYLKYSSWISFAFLISWILHLPWSQLKFAYMLHSSCWFYGLTFWKSHQTQWAVGNQTRISWLTNF